MALVVAVLPLLPLLLFVLGIQPVVIYSYQLLGASQHQELQRFQGQVRPPQGPAPPLPVFQLMLLRHLCQVLPRIWQLVLGQLLRVALPASHVHRLSWPLL